MKKGDHDDDEENIKHKIKHLLLSFERSGGQRHLPLKTYCVYSRDMFLRMLQLYTGAGKFTALHRTVVTECTRKDSTVACKDGIRLIWAAAFHESIRKYGSAW